MTAIIPIPRIPITVRPATMDDLPFIDHLQKKHTKQIGFMPTKQFEGKIKAGNVIVAEIARHGTPPHPSPLPEGEGERVGYLIGHDQYFKHDDIGIIYQINVSESHRRSLVAATLLKAQFDRSAYGCKLYCCWCAQDIEANRFWESMGFVPLAFRAGSAAKARVHIFWQKRIRQGDTTTPYWFPANTTGGSIREDRLVLPIPPGKHWSDEMPRILPVARVSNPCLPEPKKRATGCKPVLRAPTIGRLQFTAPVEAKAKPNKEPRKKQKNDPRLIAAARELRDRWLERVNEDPAMLEAGSNGKYDVTRMIGADEPRAGALLLPNPSLAA